MKTCMPSSLRPFGFILTAMTAVATLSLPISNALAVDGTWAAGSGSGNWSDSAKWVGGDIADGAGSTATLLHTSGADAITLQTGETRTVGLLDFNFNSGSNRSYDITGPGTLNFDGGSGNPGQIELSTGLDGLLGSITTNVTGSNGLEIHGNVDDPDPDFDWTPLSMGLTGGIALNSVSVNLYTTGAFGSNAVTLGSSAIVNFQAQVTFANNIVLTDSTSALRYSDSSTTGLQDINVSGVISETGGPRNMTYTTNTGAGRGRFVVSNANTYTGDTTIGGNDGTVIVQATNDGALGAGTGVDVTFNGTKTALELTGDVTISGKNLTLNGFGDADSGSLRSVSGNNVWSGNVSTGTSGVGRIRVDADRLSILGLVSGANGMDKTGNGILELTNANTYTTTTVHDGTLLLSNDSALGSGHVQVRPGGTLSVSTGISAAVSSLEILNSGNLEFALNGLTTATGLVVSGNLTGEAGTSDTDVYIVDNGIVNQTTYTLMTVAGTTPGNMTFDLHMAPGFDGSNLNWAGGVLTLNVVPEPTTGLLLGFGVAALLLAGSRKARRNRRLAA